MGYWRGSRSWRRSRGVFAAIALLGGMVLVSNPAEAVHDEGFALQGDVAATAPQLDWVDLFDVSAGVATPKASLPDGFIRAAFRADYTLPDATAYATGSKDTLPINVPGSGDWECKKVNNVGDKVDLVNAYAAAMRPTSGDSTGDLIIDFGSEISSPNGDRNAGLWLLQDKTVDCSSASGTSGWTGHHTVGDVFIVSAFTNGGTKANVTVYKWVDATPADNNADSGGSLQLMFDTGSLNDAHCDAPGISNPPINDNACAIENSTAEVTPPWAAPDKDGGNLNINEFLEGAVNLSNLNLDACFSTAIANSRSSQEPGSTLFDFVRMNFETCGNLNVHKYIDANMSGTKNAGDTNVGTDVQNYTFTVVRNSDGVTICTGTTDGNGDLVCPGTPNPLSNVAPGSYTITETQKAANFFNTDPGDDGNPATQPNFNSGTTVSKTVTVGVGDTTVEFGNTCYVDKTFRITTVPTGGAAPSSITVGWSRTRNGVVTTGTTALSATSDATVWEGSVNDNFIQSDSIAWEWWINGDTAHKKTKGTESLTTSGYPTCAKTNTDSFTLTTLNGLKFKDNDADGVHDAAEPGLGGFVFTLKRGTTVIGTTTSASDGSYSFSSIPPGTYTVSETGQTGWQQTAPASPGTASVTVSLGDTTKTIAEFGNTPLSNITVTFNPLTSPAKTKATAISCVDGANASVGSNTNTNNFTTYNVTPGQSSVVCTVTFVDP